MKPRMLSTKEILDLGEDLKDSYKAFAEFDTQKLNNVCEMFSDRDSSFFNKDNVHLLTEHQQDGTLFDFICEVAPDYIDGKEVMCYSLYRDLEKTKVI